jgi:hypothetical protein
MKKLKNIRGKLLPRYLLFVFVFLLLRVKTRKRRLFYLRTNRKIL